MEPTKQNLYTPLTMEALEFLRVKFPLWDIQERKEFNTVSLREESLTEAMEEYTLLKTGDRKA